MIFLDFGNNPINENPFVLTIHFIWIRWHNFIAEMIYNQNPSISDQIIYNEARKYTIASFQHIVFNEWLPSFIGKSLKPYKGYDSRIDPQISDLFDTISNVYIYSLVSPFVFKIDYNCSGNFRYSILRTCNTHFDPLNYLIRGRFEKILKGLLLQSAQRDDHFIVEDMLSYSKGFYDFDRQDNIAILIQYSRDFGIPDYLSVRKFLGLDKNITYASFRQLSNIRWPFAISSDPKLVYKMQQLFENNFNNIDLIVGAMLENNGREPGSLIKYLFLEQFEKLRNGDRFYFENENSGLFSKDKIKMIKFVKFSDIINLIFGDSTSNSIQPNVFLLPNDNQNQINLDCVENLDQLFSYHYCETIVDSGNCLSLSPLNMNSLENCTEGQTYDYFSGSGISFLLTLLFIPLFIIFLIILLKLLVNAKIKHNESLRIKVSKLRRMTINDDSTLVQEWLGHNDGYRNTNLTLNAKSKSIVVKLQFENRVVRCIYLKRVLGKVQVEISSNKSQNHILVRVPKEYDLVLKFDSYYDREKFLTKLESFLSELHFRMERNSVELKQIFKTAFTKAKRQKQLEKFFRVVFSQVNYCFQ